jgi:hypothetical protein
MLSRIRSAIFELNGVDVLRADSYANDYLAAVRVIEERHNRPLKAVVKLTL